MACWMRRQYTGLVEIKPNLVNLVPICLVLGQACRHLGSGRRRGTSHLFGPESSDTERVGPDAGKSGRDPQILVGLKFARPSSYWRSRRCKAWCAQDVALHKRRARTPLFRRAKQCTESEQGHARRNAPNAPPITSRPVACRAARPSRDPALPQCFCNQRLHGFGPCGSQRRD